jgi:hypothetical protein
VETTATAATGTPAVPGVASANVGQAIVLSIPPAVFAITSQGFSVNQGVQFQLKGALGGCVSSQDLVTANVNAGMTNLTVEVPECAAPDQMVRIPGHGSVRLLIVPEILAIVPDAANYPNTFIYGSGFVCEATDIIYSTGPLASNQVLSFTCNQIYISIRPQSGEQIQIKTAGGRSQLFTMP